MKSFPWVAGPLCAVLALAIATPSCIAQAKPRPVAPSTPTFAPLELWKSAVLNAKPSTLLALYSTTPPARITDTKGDGAADTEVSFWVGLKADRLKLDLIQSQTPQPGVQQVVFQAEVHSRAGTKPQVVYVTEGQVWQDQAGQWRLVATKRSDPTRLQQPTSTSKDIYSPFLDAHSEIQQALALAARQHKRVIVVFGANWCYDCHVLDLAFHRPDLASVISQNYEVVHVDVGQGDKNQDIMQRYEVPMARGIPGLAVLDSDGKLLYSQKGGEFEKARSLAPEDLLAFLNKWKPAH
jgi:hypothetical protein